MQFQTKIFVHVGNPGARLNEIGGIALFSSILLYGILKVAKIPESYSVYAFWLTGAGVVMMIVGRIISKGNMFAFGLSDTELEISYDGVRVGEVFYPIDRLTDLDFWIEGYDGMQGPRFRFRQARQSGADNKIHFRVDGKKHLYQFYLPDENAMYKLGRVFRTYYERRIPFKEFNRGGPTFLFQQVRSKQELEDMKKRDGIG